MKGTPSRWLVLCALVAAPALAQGFGASIDVGYRDDLHGNGIGMRSIEGTLGLTAVMGGVFDKNWALLFPASAAVSFSTGGAIDIGVDLEAMLRLGPVALGGGFAARFIFSPTLKDPAGERYNFLDPIPGGYTLAAKLNLFRGRAFVQGHYAGYAFTFDYRGPTPVCFGGTCVEITPPPFTSGGELKLGMGFLFDGDSGATWVLRAQVMVRWLAFARVEDNLSGRYDRETKVFSVVATHMF